MISSNGTPKELLNKIPTPAPMSQVKPAPSRTSSAECQEWPVTRKAAVHTRRSRAGTAATGSRARAQSSGRFFLRPQAKESGTVTRSAASVSPTMDLATQEAGVGSVSLSAISATKARMPTNGGIARYPSSTVFT